MKKLRRRGSLCQHCPSTISTCCRTTALTRRAQVFASCVSARLTGSKLFTRAVLKWDFTNLLAVASCECILRSQTYCLLVPRIFDQSPACASKRRGKAGALDTKMLPAAVLCRTACADRSIFATLDCLREIPARTEAVVEGGILGLLRGWCWTHHRWTGQRWTASRSLLSLTGARGDARPCGWRSTRCKIR